MKAHIKLLGTLPSHFSGSYPASGIRIDLPDDATVATAVEIIGNPKERLGMVTINGKLRHEPAFNEEVILMFN